MAIREQVSSGQIVRVPALAVASLSRLSDSGEGYGYRDGARGDARAVRAS
jgi:hypothetical protein